MTIAALSSVSEGGPVEALRTTCHINSQCDEKSFKLSAAN